MSTFEIANDMASDVREAFINRPHFVDNAPGFVKMEVLTAHDNPQVICLLTYWENEELFKTWYKHHMNESHKDIPKGLKLVPKSTRVSYFNYICN
ncbi:antibiotic biosynthesis monooxygenase family protein [Pontibacter chitinilyticus]|uniref:antibiotic biosynthesis monooxygenase family protein n=1 Tax=Pontibacter chitinilyticus TaxID=2674989 RepID=UPI0032190472